jgi:hypothetical protein
MGFYVYIARPEGSGPIDYDTLENTLNDQDYLDHVRVNEWWSPGGSLTVVKKSGQRF